MKAIATGGVHSRNSAGVRGPLSPQELHVLRTVRQELQKRSQTHKPNTSAVLPLLSMPDQPTMTIYNSVRAFKAPYVLVLRHPRLGPGDEVSRATIHEFLDENAVFANVSMLFVMRREGEPSSNFTALEALDEISSWMLTAVLASLRIAKPGVFAELVAEVVAWREMSNAPINFFLPQADLVLDATALVNKHLDKFIAHMVRERIVAASYWRVNRLTEPPLIQGDLHERWTDHGTFPSHVEAVNPSNSLPVSGYAQLVTMSTFLQIHAGFESKLAMLGTAILDVLSVSAMMRVRSDSPLVNRLRAETEPLLRYQDQYGLVSISKEPLPRDHFEHIFYEAHNPEWLLDSFLVKTFFVRSAESELLERQARMEHGQQDVFLMELDEEDETQDDDHGDAQLSELVRQRLFPPDYGRYRAFDMAHGQQEVADSDEGKKTLRLRKL